MSASLHFDISSLTTIIGCLNEQLVATMLLGHRLARGEGKM
jgi:hypothetical protein